jgi:hypothetical protein
MFAIPIRFLSASEPGGRGGHGSAYPIFKTPASICFGGPNPGVWAFPVIGTPTRASDHGSGDAQQPAAVVVDCSMHQAPRSHLFPYAVKM